MIRISTRLVFLIGNRVYKFPLSRRGHLQSKNEKVIWDKYNHLGLLGTFYWRRFGINCMQRYTIVKEIDPTYIYTIKDEIQELNIERCDLYNHKNWGISNGKYYLIDYGINEYISTLYK
jgi:hypothetical protein